MAGLLGAAAQAHGQLYVCADAQGHKTYTDRRAGAHCQLLDLPGALTEPPRKTAPLAGAPARPATQAAVTAAPAAGAFPKVDGAEQRARDLDRRQILQDELRSEEQKLAAQRLEFNGGQPERQGNERNYAKYQERVAQLKDNISRTQQNVEALKREIANIR
ncbi:DUF4124 domain-containing protein [Janthinobacterium agaricidamnosum]|uniref:DUF4124 domain-containing protein n=1 Tax=Janthinobacterium agaricidamnosum TaxID=55508 RepID=A0A3G2EGJ4_9BURK|nr:MULTISPECIES: DUF4124 domain-containing protein [Janthinobacterium]AYM79378.1 DUF4124 domain-containing protein [Janthinobacterium agaricidamnosum]